MRRIAYLVFFVVGLMPSMKAQPDTWPWNAIDLVNYWDASRMSRYMYHVPINLEKNDTVYWNPIPQSTITDTAVQNDFTGISYTVQSPQTIYGIATAIPYYSNQAYNIHHINDVGFFLSSYPPDTIPRYLGKMFYPAFADSNFDAMIVQKAGDAYIRVDSVAFKRYNIMSFFNVGSLVERNFLNIYIHLVEFYFDNPVTVHDTFYVGLGNTTKNRHRNPVTSLGFMGIYNPSKEITCDGKLIHLSGNRQYYNPLNDGDSILQYWPLLFPIVEPRPACTELVEGFQYSGRSMGLPVFTWEFPDYTYGYDIEFAQKDQPFDSMYRIFVNRTPPYTIQYIFDSSVYYKARIRCYCSPFCAAHNSILPGPWSDSILFYTGNTAPDTTTTTHAVSPQQDEKSLFVLLPNPARNRTTVRATSGIKHLEMTDPSGHIVWNKKNDGNPVEVEIVLTGLVSGIYAVQAETENGIATEKLIVE